MALDPFVWSARLLLPSDVQATSSVLEEVGARMRERDWAARDIHGVQLSLEEALNNAIRHGNRRDHSKRVRFQCEVSWQHIRALVADEGAGFSPDDVPDCVAEENLDKPGGRGLHLMRHYMTRVAYNRAGNVVVLEKDRR